jgi:integration host factor beta subunit
MNKSDLIEVLARQNGMAVKQSEVVINTIFDSMIDALNNGDKIEIRGFGSICNREYQARTGRNPKTGKLVDVKQKKSPFFKAGKELRERLAKSKTKGN